VTTSATLSSTLPASASFPEDSLSMHALSVSLIADLVVQFHGVEERLDDSEAHSLVISQMMNCKCR
jgi:hypothetical protein